MSIRARTATSGLSCSVARLKQRRKHPARAATGMLPGRSPLLPPSQVEVKDSLPPLQEVPLALHAPPRVAIPAGSRFLKQVTARAAATAVLNARTGSNREYTRYRLGQGR